MTREAAGRGGGPEEAADGLRRRARPLARPPARGPRARAVRRRRDPALDEAGSTRSSCASTPTSRSAVTPHSPASWHARRRHPLRERLRAQQILALYRAAARPRRSRRTRTPGARSSRARPRTRARAAALQQAILDQARSSCPAAQARRNAPRRRRAPLAAGAAALAGTVVAASPPHGDERPPRSNRLRRGARGHRRRERADRAPAARGPHAGRGDARGRPPMGRRRRRADAPRRRSGDRRGRDARDRRAPDRGRRGAGAVWVANGRPIRTRSSSGPVHDPGSCVSTPRRGRSVRRWAAARRGRCSNAAGNRLAVSENAVWAVAPSGAVVRIDAETATITRTAGKLGALAVAAGAAGVWALRRDGGASQLDEATGGCAGEPGCPRTARRRSRWAARRPG